MKSYTAWQKGDLDLTGPRAVEVLQPSGTNYHQILGHVCLSSESLWVMATEMLLFFDANKSYLCGYENYITTLLSLPTFYLAIIISQVQLTFKTGINTILCCKSSLFNQ